MERKRRDSIKKKTKLVVTKGEGRRDKLGIFTTIYKITNKDLLYSTRN